MKQAIRLNAVGIAHLQAGNEQKACDCFKRALRIVSNLCREESKGIALPISSSHNNEGIHIHKTRPITWVCTSAREQRFITPFLIDSGDQDDSYETGSFYSSVIIFNYALLLQQKNGGGDEISLHRASLLYKHSLELLGAISESFDREEVDELAECALHNLADTYYKLGDYHNFRATLDSVLILNVKTKLTTENPKAPPNQVPTAPAA